MAQIRVAERHGRYVVTVNGPLQASDLRQLEHACGRALEHKAAPLVIVLQSAFHDASVAAYLDRLGTRGAVVRERFSNVGK
jgi:hypothetical protein